MYKVLLVEDDPLMSRMYQRVFVFNEFDIQLAGNGKEGLEKIAAFKPDIVLIDVMMPIMNGMEMLAKLKADPATKDLPVLMLTNLADVKTAEEATKAGALNYFVKSQYDPDQIASSVKEILDKAA
jgi:DNA-binding response OmpR family regulator